MNWIDLPGIILHAELCGQGPTGLVLLHELGSSLENFDTVVALLSGQFRILRYDQRGAGQSEKPRAAFTLEDHAADLGALLSWAEIDTPILLVGVAAGCAIAVTYALAAPAQVGGLLLCCPALTVPQDRFAYLQNRSNLAARDGMRAVADASLERSFASTLRGDEAGFTAYRARFIAADPIGYSHANMVLARSDLSQRLHELTQPCYVLAGRHDVLRPPDIVRPVAAAISGARFAEVESGHLMPVQAPDVLAEAVLALARRSFEKEPA